MNRFYCKGCGVFSMDCGVECLHLQCENYNEAFSFCELLNKG